MKAIYASALDKLRQGNTLISIEMLCNLHRILRDEELTLTTWRSTMDDASRRYHTGGLSEGHGD